MANICKLCDSASQLQKSHAIPDSIFRRIFRANSGKAILLKTGAGDIQYTNDSLATPQLCSKCERLINENYEKYSIDILRGGRGSASETSNGITFSGIDVNKLRMFFIAIFWRAANSTHTTYSGAVMPVEFYHEDVNKTLKKAILTNTPIRANLGCKHMKGLEKMSVVFQDKFANTPKNTTGESWQQTSTSCKPFQRVLNNSRLKQAHSAVPEKSRIPPN